MKELPISFNTEMVRAILGGRKTQTRRPISEKLLKLFDQAYKIGEISPFFDTGELHKNDLSYSRQLSPKGQIGGLLYVREAFWLHDDWNAFSQSDGNITHPDGTRRLIGYDADMDLDSIEIATEYGVKRHQPTHMPKWAARIWLEITNIRVERVQDISTDDCMSEGISKEISFHGRYFRDGSYLIGSFRHLWDSIYEDRGYSWNLNPFVWVVEFKVVEK